MSPAKNSINTSDAIEKTVHDAAMQKQIGNTRSLLLQNMPGARELRSVVSSATGLIESIGDTAYRILSLGARPQDLTNITDIARNGIKTVFAESPKVETKGTLEYLQNLRGSKLKRDALAAYHDPYKNPTAYYNTHGSKYSMSPKKTDNRFKKIVKGIPFITGKVIKAPLWATSTVVGAVTDTARRIKGQKLRDAIGLKFHKTSRDKTTYAAKKLFSRAYNPESKREGGISDISSLPQKIEEKVNLQEEEKETYKSEKSYDTTDKINRDKAKKAGDTSMEDTIEVKGKKKGNKKIKEKEPIGEQKTDTDITKDHHKNKPEKKEIVKDKPEGDQEADIIKNHGIKSEKENVPENKKPESKKESEPAQEEPAGDTQEEKETTNATEKQKLGDTKKEGEGEQETEAKAANH